MSNELDNNIIDEAVIGQAAPDFKLISVVDSIFIKAPDFILASSVDSDDPIAPVSLLDKEPFNGVLAP